MQALIAGTNRGISMPIPFTCPYCGNYTEVSEKYSGTSGPCGSCGKTITVPVGGSAATAAVTYGGADPGSGSRTMILVIVVIVVALLAAVGLLVLLLLPAVGTVRDAARRNMCQSNLRQIAMALRTYETVHGRFPPAYVADDQGKPMHSWRVLILPYLEEQALYEQFDLDQPWDSPQNSAVALQMPEYFRCPSAKNTAPNATNYMLITGPQTPFEGDQSSPQASFVDGMSRTILVVEAKGSTVTWTEPVDLDIDKMSFQVGSGPGEIGSDHARGVAVAVFADGHATVLSEDLDPETLRAMCTSSGGETVDMSWQK
jgi:ribosomal protein S27E